MAKWRRFISRWVSHIDSSHRMERRGPWAPRWERRLESLRSARALWLEFKSRVLFLWEVPELAELGVLARFPVVWRARPVTEIARLGPKVTYTRDYQAQWESSVFPLSWENIQQRKQKRTELTFDDSGGVRAQQRLGTGAGARGQCWARPQARPSI